MGRLEQSLNKLLQFTPGPDLARPTPIRPMGMAMARSGTTEPDPASNPSDDKGVAVLEEHADDPVAEELASSIEALSADEQIDLVALAWLGRDGTGPEDWPETRREAARAHNNRTAGYLLGMPMLADFVEEGLSMLGHSCEEYEIGRL